MSRDTDRWNGDAGLPDEEPAQSGGDSQEIPEAADGGTEPVQEDRISFRNEKAANIDVGPARTAPPTGQPEGWNFVLEAAAGGLNGEAAESAPDGAEEAEAGPAAAPAAAAAGGPEDLPGFADGGEGEAESGQPQQDGGLQGLFGGADEAPAPQAQESPSGESEPEFAADDDLPGDAPAASGPSALESAFGAEEPEQAAGQAQEGGLESEFGEAADNAASHAGGGLNGGLEDAFDGLRDDAGAQPQSQSGFSSGLEDEFGQDAASGTAAADNAAGSFLSGGLENEFGGAAEAAASSPAGDLGAVFGQDSPDAASQPLDAAPSADGFAGGGMGSGLEGLFGQDSPDAAAQPASGLEAEFGQDGVQASASGDGLPDFGGQNGAVQSGGLEDAFGGPSDAAAPSGGMSDVFGGAGQNGGAEPEFAAQDASVPEFAADGDSGTASGVDAGGSGGDLFGLGQDGASQPAASAGDPSGAGFADAFSGIGAEGAFGASIPLGGNGAADAETVIPGPEAKPVQLGGEDMQAAPRTDAEPVHDQVQGDPMSKTRNRREEAPEAPEAPDAAGFQVPDGDGPAWMMQGAASPSPEALAAEGVQNAAEGGWEAAEDGSAAAAAVQQPVKGRAGMKNNKIILVAGGAFLLIAFAVVAWLLFGGSSSKAPAVRQHAQRPAPEAAAKPEERAQRPIAPGVEENMRRMTGRGLSVEPAASVPGAEAKKPSAAELLAQAQASREAKAPASAPAPAVSVRPAEPAAAARPAAAAAAPAAASVPAPGQLSAGLSKADREKLDSISERLDKAIAILEGMKPEAVDDRLRAELESLRKARNDLQESLRAKERMVDELTTENARLKKGAPAQRSGRGQAQRAESRPSSSGQGGAASLKSWRILGLSNTLAVLEDPEGRIWHAGKGGKAGPLEIKSVDVATGNVETSAGTLKYGQEE